MKAKDNQITGKNGIMPPELWFSYKRLVNLKHISIECWSEIKEDELLPYINEAQFLIIKASIRNQGGRTYLVTLIGKDK